MLKRTLVALGAAALLALSACSTGTSSTPDTPELLDDGTGTVEQSELVRTIRENFPGYPLVVDTSTLSDRVSQYVETDQVVAVAPGLYAPFNPAIPDLDSYIDDSPVLGDCMMMHTYFEGHGGTCWDGVPPGSAEPAL